MIRMSKRCTSARVLRREITSAHRINQGSIPISVARTRNRLLFLAAGGSEDRRRPDIELVKARIPKRFSLDPICKRLLVHKIRWSFELLDELLLSEQQVLYTSKWYAR
jgi:hypothetical protein